MPKSVQAKEKMQHILKTWKAEKKVITKNDYPISFRGLLTKEVYDLIKSFGWTKRGKFVRLVIGSLAGMGYIPTGDIERVVKKDLLSEKFDKPLAEMMGKY